jgi:ABC-type multidrug transport system fused ATPase/permease subunit
MSSLRSRIFKLFIFLTYPLLVFVIVALATLLFLENRKVNVLNQTFEDARSSLNKENVDQQITINDLTQEFQAQSAKIAELNQQNDNLRNQVAKLEQNGLATISGRILPFVTSGSNNFTQFQRVCVESVSNTNVQFCRTVSPVEQNFDLYVSPGTYYVYAEVFPQPQNQESPVYGVKTYYTEYVKCVAEKSTSDCNQQKLTKPVAVVITSGQNLENINPIDWR